MVHIKRRRDYFVLITGNSNHYSDDDDFPKSYSPNCESYGFYNLLQERIYREDQLINGEIPREAENWLSCYTCGQVVPIVHARLENDELVGIKEI